MAIKTPQGLMVMVECSHPGIEKILEAAEDRPDIYSIYGGLHLVDVSDSDVTGMVTRFRDKWEIERVGAEHCTGEFAFSEMNCLFGPRFDHSGVGNVIALPK